VRGHAGGARLYCRGLRAWRFDRYSRAHAARGQYGRFHQTPIQRRVESLRHAPDFEVPQSCRQDQGLSVPRASLVAGVRLWVWLWVWGAKLFVSVVVHRARQMDRAGGGGMAERQKYELGAPVGRTGIPRRESILSEARFGRRAAGCCISLEISTAPSKPNRSCTRLI
jgi:hypothetical protein